MEIRKWMLVLLATAIVGKFFAAGLSRAQIFKESKIAQIERAATEKISKWLKSTEEMFVKPVPKPMTPPKPVLPVVKTAPPGISRSPFVPVVAKPNPKVAAEQQEKERRKKRKKKLEQAADKNKKAPQVSVTTVGKEETKQESPKSQTIDYIVTSVTNNPPPKDDTAATAVQAVDLHAWLNLLTAQPTTANLQAFYSLYKAGRITAGQYYSVMDTLIKSSVVELRKLAITGSSFEPNFLAFSILVHEKYNERVAQLQNLTLQALAKYKDQRYLAFLIQPLSRGDVMVKLEASDTIGLIVTAMNGSPATLTAAARDSLTRTMPILIPLTTDNSQQALQASAQNTLRAIRTILGLTTVASSP